MKNKKPRIVSPFVYKILKLLVRPVAFFLWKYRYKDFYKIAKNENVVVLSNHQTDIDPILIQLSFNQLLHTVATDNLFKKGFVNNFLTWLGAIPKRKGVTDLRTGHEMSNVVKEGGSLLIFPEGNRSYAEFQYYIAPNIGRLVKSLDATLVVFNLHGGTGVKPRFASKRRKGPFYGTIRRVIKRDEYANMTCEELSEIIINDLRVYDSDSGSLYKCKKRAEYLERMLFVCPVCGKAQTLSSKNEFISCSSCGLKVEFTEDLHLKSDNSAFKFTRLVEWYNLQKKWVRELEVKGDEPIFVDHNVKLNSAELHKKKVVLSTGDLMINQKEIIFGEHHFDLTKIEIASPVSGRKFVFTYEGIPYEAKGNEQFNPLKYVLLLNKLDTQMKRDKVDKYYSLEEDEK